MSVNEGKMIRPTLALCTYQMITGKKLTKDIIRAALSLELNHKFLLIHDDIADNDKIRYGKRNIIGLYEERFAKSHPSRIELAERYALSVSMVAGDVNHTFVYDILLKSKINEKLKIKLANTLGKIMSATARGWKEEYEFTNKEIQNVSEEDVINNLKYITSNYTTEGPILYGYEMSESKNLKLLKLINQYSIPLGIAYQIKDDLLSLFGEQEKMGQEIKSDIKEGKKTIHLLYAYSKASKEEKELISKNLGNKNVTKDEIDKIKKIVIKTGAKDYSEKVAKDFITNSLKSLKKISLDNKYKKVLLELAYFSIEREK